MKAIVFHGVGDISPMMCPSRRRKENPMSIGDLASDFGKGLFAGAAGTAAMTVTSTLEMKLSGRGASDTPAQAAEAVLSPE